MIIINIIIIIFLIYICVDNPYTQGDPLVITHYIPLERELCVVCCVHVFVYIFVL